jgi:dTDP-4-amino-4,6-dideoxy-D-galactose acyltransferase
VNQPFFENYKILQWDTDYFGYITAKIIPKKLKINEIKKSFKNMLLQNVKLAYWASDPTDEESQKAANLLKGILVDKKSTYYIDIANEKNTRIIAPNKWKNTVEEYTKETPCTALLKLAIQSGIYSRFRVDPNIGMQQFEEIYRQWIINSTNKKVADAVLVAKSNNKIIGMVTVKKENNIGNIGLIAVDKQMQKQNIGSALLQAAHTWFLSHDCTIFQVVTQKDNISGCRLYEKAGYSLKRLEYFYHFWL